MNSSIGMRARGALDLAHSLLRAFDSKNPTYSAAMLSIKVHVGMGSWKHGLSSDFTQTASQATFACQTFSVSLQSSYTSGSVPIFLRRFVNAVEVRA